MMHLPIHRVVDDCDLWRFGHDARWVQVLLSTFGAIHLDFIVMDGGPSGGQ